MRRKEWMGRAARQFWSLRAFGWVLLPFWAQLCMDFSYKGELKTIDGKISTTLLIPLIPSFSEKLRNNKYSAEMVVC